MQRPTLAFIGAGRAGNALAKRFFTLGYPIIGIYSKRLESAQKLAIEVNSVALTDYPSADLLFLTVPDGAIAEVAQDLARHGYVRSVIHTSGVHGVESLEPLGNIGSFHPLYPFRDGTLLRGDEGMLIGIEANSPTLADQLVTLAQDLGGRPALLKPGEKARYHAAATLASNYLVTLFEMSLKLMQTAGVEKENARQALANLMQGNVDNLRQLDPSSALTGAIARGDITTVQKHLAVLAASDYTKAYCELGKLTVKLAPNLDDTTRQQLLDLLT